MASPCESGSTRPLQLEVIVGDVLQQTADVLICPANPWLNMSGGVNGEILLRGGDSIQAELRAYLAESGKSAVEPGTVIRTSGSPLAFQHILHTVAIDPFYDSSERIVANALANALERAGTLGARSIAMPTLATGYGRLPVAAFASALLGLVQRDWSPVKQVTVVVRNQVDSDAVQQVLAAG